MFRFSCCLPFSFHFVVIIIRLFIVVIIIIIRLFIVVIIIIIRLFIVVIIIIIWLFITVIIIALNLTWGFEEEPNLTTQ